MTWEVKTRLLREVEIFARPTAPSVSCLRRTMYIPGLPRPAVTLSTTEHDVSYEFINYWLAGARGYAAKQSASEEAARELRDVIRTIDDSPSHQAENSHLRPRPIG